MQPSLAQLFVSPHSDDVALSCGGRIARLVADGGRARLVTLFSGTGGVRSLTPYQRRALGFAVEERAEQGEREAAEAAARAARDAEQLMASRRNEDRAFAAFAGLDVAFLDLPDAVFRGYTSDLELFGRAREDDLSVEAIADALMPQLVGIERVHAPAGIGWHVDHVAARDAALLAGRRSGIPVEIYEDFPYTWRLGVDAPNGATAEAIGRTLAEAAGERRAIYHAIDDVLARRLDGISCYRSQVVPLFGSAEAMVKAVRESARRCAMAGGLDGLAERTWVADPA